MSEYRKSLLLGIAFCLLAAVLTGIYLLHSYQQEKRAVEERITRTSYLIGEWIKSAFAQSDYVLRDIVSAVDPSELHYPTSNAKQHERRNRWLDAKRGTVPHARLVALYDGQCVITHNPNALNETGLDAGGREYCKKFRDSPDLERWVTPAYVPAGTNQLNVAQFRRIPGNGLGLQGLAAFAINLDLFVEWTGKLPIGPHGAIAISDTEATLLARNPHHPKMIGMHLGSAFTDEFRPADGEHRVLHTVSPVDGRKHLYSMRKLAELPFYIGVTEADTDWLADWWQRVWIALAGLGCLYLLVFLNIRDYWNVLRQREEQTKFISMLAHELKTPLSVIRMSVGSASRSAEVDKRISRSVRAMQDVVERCLLAGRLDSGQLSASPEVVDVAALLTSIRDGMEVPERIELDIAALPACSTDQQLLRAILANLLDNALKYGQRGLPVRLDAAAAYRNGRAGIAFVISNPPGSAGFPDPRQVFRKYYRASAAHGTTGSGLGLHLAAGFTSKLGGELSYQPTDDMVRFSLWIPL